MRRHTFRGLGQTVTPREGAARWTLAARTAAVLAVLAMLLGSVPTGALAQDEWSPPTEVYVKATGHTLSEPFLTVWRERKRYLGDPISEPVKRKVPVAGVETKTRTVQYFQNAALVQTRDDPRGDGWDVQALRLGVLALHNDRDDIPAIELRRSATCEGMRSRDCRAFEETANTLRHGFKDYWEANDGQQMIGAPITEEFTAEGGWSVQYFERGVLKWTQKRGVVPSATGARFVDVERVDTTKVKRPSGVPVYEAAIFTPPIVEEIEEAEVEEVEEAERAVPSGPGPQQGAFKEIVVSVSQQYMWAYEGNEVVIETLVSTGTAEVIETTTPQGFWAINAKVDVQDMEGTISGEDYFVADVPYVMYFDNLGNALHGTYWHSNFGAPMSHGCVNLPMDVASFLYGWADVGTAVTVI